MRGDRRTSKSSLVGCFANNSRDLDEYAHEPTRENTYGDLTQKTRANLLFAVSAHGAVSHGGLGPFSRNLLKSKLNKPTNENQGTSLNLPVKNSFRGSLKKQGGCRWN